MNRPSLPPAEAETSQVAGPVTDPLAQSVQADAELLGLGERLISAWAEESAAWALAERESGDDGPYTRRACMLSVVTRYIIDRIRITPARTSEGVMVKAMAVAWCRCADPFSDDAEPEPVEEDPDTESLLLHGLMEDVRAIVRAAA